jgi:hypothetical protein
MISRTINTGITRIKFQNSHTVYENFIKCTIKDYEFNLSYNPTLLSGSQAALYPYSASVGGSVFFNPTGSEYFGILKDFTTGSISGSEFSPYASEVGLYNDAGDLLAVAKLAAPMPLSSNTDMTFLIKFDTQWINKPYFTPSATPSMTPQPSLTPSVTPSVTPSITPSISVTPSITPSVTTSISVTPTISVTPSITPSVTTSISVTPTISVTPSISITPSVTPSVPTSAPVSVWYQITNCADSSIEYSEEYPFGTFVINDRVTSPGNNWVVTGGVYTDPGGVLYAVASTGFKGCP